MAMSRANMKKQTSTAGDRNEAYGGFELDKDYKKKPESAKEQRDRVKSGKYKCGGKVHGKKSYKSGGKVRGSGCCKRVKKCKMY